MGLSWGEMAICNLWLFNCGLVTLCDNINLGHNIGSSNGLLLDGTMPIPELMLTDHHWSPVISIFIWGQFHKPHLQSSVTKFSLKINHLKCHSDLPGVNELSIISIQLYFLMSHVTMMFQKYHGICSTACSGWQQRKLQCCWPFVRGAR